MHPIDYRETSHSSPLLSQPGRGNVGGRGGFWAVAVAFVFSAASVATACLDRPLCADDCQPRTTDVFVTEVQGHGVDKIDLLFMIDNSSSMADKQKILQAAVPDLVQRLVSPNCVDPSTGEPAAKTPTEPTVDCAPPAIREFSPIRDIHVGIITSSLGGHGATGVADCVGNDSGTLSEQEQNDHGWLIGKRSRFSTPSGGQSVDANGFLDWNPSTHPGQTTEPFNITFRQMTTLVGEEGCGYESQLESIYRFLVDPHPYATVTKQNCPNSSEQCAVPQGRDDALLAQRKAFLRQDSLVAIIMLTDENDCSIRESGQAYYAVEARTLDRGATICATNPNDRCCYFCNTAPPSGCAPDPICAMPQPPDSDPANLRCFHQKQRYGYDFLYPTARYVNAFTKPTICTSRDDLAPDPGNCRDADGDRQPDLVDNPLFKTDTAAARDTSFIFFAGIIGVPWQDIQTTTKPDGTPYSKPTELHYRTAKELDKSGAWDVILGKSNPGNGQAPVLPSDSLMIESRDPRGGMDAETPPAPLVGIEGGSLANKVNGHEWANPRSDDLQYACIFKLAEPKSCANLPSTQAGCDCKEDDVAPTDPSIPPSKNPLCQDEHGNYSTSQQFGKAYPGLRELEVLKGFGENSIVASICARNPDRPAEQDYGYRPAVDAIVERLKDKLAGSCLPRPLSPDASGKIPCSVVEVTPKTKGAPTSCNIPGRKDADLNVIASARLQIRNAGNCDALNKPDCVDLSVCEIQVAGPECHTGATPVSPGWCYVDPATQKGDNRALVAGCSATARRIIRFVDPDNRTPAPGATALIACFGATIPDDTASSGGAPATL